jgi:Coenzyme PQQ synthesis protein D (PqqD)
MTNPEEISVRPVAKKGLELVESPDGLIVYDTTTDRVHHLNQTAAVILALCDGTQTVDDLTTAVGGLFESGDVTPEITRECLEHLTREQLIS